MKPKYRPQWLPENYPVDSPALLSRSNETFVNDEERRRTLIVRLNSVIGLGLDETQNSLLGSLTDLNAVDKGSNTSIRSDCRPGTPNGILDILEKTIYNKEVGFVKERSKKIRKYDQERENDHLTDGENDKFIDGNKHDSEDTNEYQSLKEKQEIKKSENPSEKKIQAIGLNQMISDESCSENSPLSERGEIINNLQIDIEQKELNKCESREELSTLEINRLCEELSRSSLKKTTEHAEEIKSLCDQLTHAGAVSLLEINNLDYNETFSNTTNQISENLKPVNCKEIENGLGFTQPSQVLPKTVDASTSTIDPEIISMFPPLIKASQSTSCPQIHLAVPSSAVSIDADIQKVEESGTEQRNIKDDLDSVSAIDPLGLKSDGRRSMILQATKKMTNSIIRNGKKVTQSLAHSTVTAKNKTEFVSSLDISKINDKSCQMDVADDTENKIKKKKKKKKGKNKKGLIGENDYETDDTLEKGSTADDLKKTMDKTQSMNNTFGLDHPSSQMKKLTKGQRKKLRQRLKKMSMYETFAYGKRSSDTGFQKIIIERNKPGNEDVQLAIKYCGICYIDGACIRDPLTKWPLVPGHEISGIVTATGKDVNSFKIGDHVGIGCIADSCMNCQSCNLNEEHLCSEGMTMTCYDETKHGHIATDVGHTHGGYSGSYTTHQRFIIKIPKEYPLEYAGPIFCSGINMFSPLVHWNASNGSKRVGIIGIGGLGKIGIQMALSMGNEVTAISPDASDKDIVLAMGANRFIHSTDKESMEYSIGSQDLILNTKSNPIDEYIPLLVKGGTIVIVGAGPEYIYGINSKLLLQRKSVSCSFLGGMKETQDCINYCANHGIRLDIELISPERIDEIHQIMSSELDPLLRYVLDCRGDDKQ